MEPGSLDGPSCSLVTTSHIAKPASAKTSEDAKWATSPPPILPGFEAWLTVSVVDSLVQIYRKAEKVPESLALRAAYGDTISEQSGRFFLDMSLLKTLNNSRDAGLIAYYATLPASGMMRNGSVFRLASSGPGTCASGLGYLPTPMFGDGRAYYVCSRESALRCMSGHSIKPWMAVAIISSGLPKGMANPAFSEIMMGLPVGFTFVSGWKR